MNYRAIAEGAEERTLFRGAAFSRDHRRERGAEDDHRLPYKRDVDRIVHSKAYARYIDKTQVAYAVENDHVTHRVLHVQLVSNFARGIAEILRLNLDLVEAVALGHDVGHPPFAHDGEIVLDALVKEFGGTGFKHNEQSCRLFRDVEPLNLGVAVYDGFLHHDGGMKSCKLVPGEEGMPATLEGCLVKISDTVSYLGRDIEDAIRLGIIRRGEVPETILGRSNGEILSFVAQDIIENSYERDWIGLSEEVYEALKVIRAFNFEAIYLHKRLKIDRQKVERSFRIVLEAILAGELIGEFLEGKSEQYLAESSELERAVDYVAGMTDRYFVSTVEGLVVPR